MSRKAFRVNGLTLAQSQRAYKASLRRRAKDLMAEYPQKAERIALVFQAVKSLREAGIPHTACDTNIYINCTVADLQKIRRALGPMKLLWRDAGEDGKLRVSLEPTANPSVLITYATEIKPGAKCKIVERTHKVLLCER